MISIYPFLKSWKQTPFSRSVILHSQKKKEDRQCGYNSPKQTSTMVNRVYDSNVDGNGTSHTGVADSSGTEYVHVTDSNISFNFNYDSKYNTIQMNVNRNIGLNYSHIQIRSDVLDDHYDHTANISGNIHREADMYSHLNDTCNERKKSGLNTEFGNFYDTVNGQSVEMDVLNEDPCYDLTNTRPGTEIDMYD